MPDTWFTSRSGLKCDLARPTAEMIHWPDIAVSLSKICRFNGHCKGFYSVAEHCVRVADLLPQPYRIYGLLHDAHEAWTGNIITPVKNMLGREAIAKLESAVDDAIYAKAGVLPPDPCITDTVKNADARMFATEVRDLIDPIPPELARYLSRIEADARRIEPYRPEFAATLWLSRLNGCLWV